MEPFRAHPRVSRREARERTPAMPDAVRIRTARHAFDACLHEVSGGMGQRIAIATTKIPEPDLFIADEPASALDATVRLQALSVLDDLVDRRGASLVFVSHDLNPVASICDRVLVMYAGRVMETLRADELCRARHPCTPAHPGTRQLLLASRGYDRTAVASFEECGA